MKSMLTQLSTKLELKLKLKLSLAIRKKGRVEKIIKYGKQGKYK